MLVRIHHELGDRVPTAWCRWRIETRGTMAWFWVVCSCIRLLARTKFVFSRFLAFGLCMKLFEPWLRWNKQHHRLSLRPSFAFVVLLAAVIDAEPCKAMSDSTRAQETWPVRRWESADISMFSSTRPARPFSPPLSSSPTYTRLLACLALRVLAPT